MPLRFWTQWTLTRKMDAWSVYALSGLIHSDILQVSDTDTGSSHTVTVTTVAELHFGPQVTLKQLYISSVIHTFAILIRVSWGDQRHACADGLVNNQVWVFTCVHHRDRNFKVWSVHMTIHTYSILHTLRMCFVQNHVILHNISTTFKI